MKFAAVAIGYNRKSDFQRLITSLQRAQYGNDTVDLIMSIDNSGVSDVQDYASEVEWSFGKRIIRTFETRQGLRQHILKCGDFLDEYDAIAVFEDDVYASPVYYFFAKQCVEKYANDERIAGISLYGHLENVYARYAFIPDHSGADAYFMQIAQSWGQVWLKKQWRAFSSWYKKNEHEFAITNNIPDQLGDWGKNSWLKYHNKYCAETGKFFVYPYVSLTTCFCSAGEHSVVQSDIYQVPVQRIYSNQYKLPSLDDEVAVCYDPFFERLNLHIYDMKIESQELLIDIYGLKGKQDQDYRYILTTRLLPYKIVKSYARTMRPHELNVIEGIDGYDLFLYDTSERATVTSKRHIEERKYIYYNKVFANSITCLKVALLLLKENLKKRFLK